MLVGHPEGNIIQVIKSFVLKCVIALKNSNDMCSDGENMCTAEETSLILKCIMDRYANIWGTYFVKVLNGKRGANTMNTQVTLLKTCTNILSTIASSKVGVKSK